MHDGHRERLKRRYVEHGPEAMEDHELLELLLCYAIPRRDVNPLAHRLINVFGSLESVMQADLAALMDVEGVGESTAVLIHLVGAVYKRAAQRGFIRRKRLTTREDAGAYVQTLLAGRNTEAFYALFLDNQHRLIRPELVVEGDHGEVRVNARELVQKALNCGAAHVILAHNHPGGSCEPSAADVQLTEKLRDMLGALDIGCPEHFIVADGSVYAMGMRGRVDLSNRGGDNVVRLREANGVLDPYELARMLKALDLSQLDIVLGELD